MTDTPLNLARKWRSRQFDQIIGQELVVRLLKNSLYRSLFFPVYLFSGMRGCGKTTMARLFAAALNCKALDNFCKTPQQVILPCLECISCQAMQQGQHPDFIELDAASHTGVENIRAIIDVASYIPAIGRKKVYLIDEAHMLSKAAFNALLKTLEEPPATALFLLATTDFYKIIDTVRSRCFQLFFGPLTVQELYDHLAYICAQETIIYEPEALRLVAHESEGSVRDALNILERVRLAQSRITVAATMQVLGSADSQHIQALLVAVFNHDQKLVLELCNKYIQGRVTLTCFFKKCIELLRAALYTKLNVVSVREQLHEYSFDEQFMQALVSCSSDYIINLLELCSNYELTIAKTAHPYMLLEVMLLTMCRIQQSQSPPQLRQASQASTPSTPKPIAQESAPKAMQVAKVTQCSQWQLFLNALVKINDPLIMSIFQQARFIQYTQESVSVAFAQGATFFKDWLLAAKTVWQPLLEKSFNSAVMLDMQFIDAHSAAAHTGHFAPVMLKAQAVSAHTETVYTTKDIKKTTQTSYKVSKLVSIDADSWPKASLITRVFPGTITYKPD